MDYYKDRNRIINQKELTKNIIDAAVTKYPEEARRIQKEAQSYEAQEEKRRKEASEQMRQYVNTLSKAELRERLLAYMVEEQERRYY